MLMWNSRQPNLQRGECLNGCSSGNPRHDAFPNALPGAPCVDVGLIAKRWGPYGLHATSSLPA